MTRRPPTLALMMAKPCQSSGAGAGPPRPRGDLETKPVPDWPGLVCVPLACSPDAHSAQGLAGALLALPGLAQWQVLPATGLQGPRGRGPWGWVHPSVGRALGKPHADRAHYGHFTVDISSTLFSPKVVMN